ncbi:YY1-associated factor 2 [Collichthys lucidus]|uniref:YY1-associated factor 2 n=1 Tax=Collichthys lucidus TaxID=240159 RepID=A0A4V6AT43_COLLU|nr:YY1-associated factor 2 [Collichthys lucidus]
MGDKRSPTRPKRQPKPSSDEGFWDCSVCTYKNTAEAFKCMMCDVRKGTSTRRAPRASASSSGGGSTHRMSRPANRQPAGPLGIAITTGRQAGERSSEGALVVEWLSDLAWARPCIVNQYEKRHIFPVPSRSPLVPMKPKAPAVAPAVAPSPGDTLAFRVPKDYPHSRFSKAPLAVYPPKGARNKTCVSLPVVSLEKMPCLNRADSASHVRLTSSPLPLPRLLLLPQTAIPHSPRPPPVQREAHKRPRHQRAVHTRSTTTSPSSLDGRPSPARSPLDRRPSSTPSPSPLDRKHSPSPSPSHRSGTLLVSSASPLDRKHQNGTKTPSRSQKRLSGPAEGGAKEKDKDATQGGKEGGGSQSITSQDNRESQQASLPKWTTPVHLKLRLANAHIPRVPGSTTSTSSPLPPAPATAPAPNPEPSPTAGRRQQETASALK